MFEVFDLLQGFIYNSIIRIMGKGMIQKGLAVCITLLFVGLSFVPSITAQNIHQESNNEIRDLIQTLTDISNDSEIKKILMKYRFSKQDNFLSGLFLINDNSQINQMGKEQQTRFIQSYTIENQDYINNIIEVTVNNEDLLDKIQDLSLNDNICNLLWLLFFSFGFIATYFESDMIIYWLLWIIFAPLSLLCGGLYILIGCPLDPYP